MVGVRPGGSRSAVKTTFKKYPIINMLARTPTEDLAKHFRAIAPARRKVQIVSDRAKCSIGNAVECSA